MTKAAACLVFACWLVAACSGEAQNLVSPAGAAGDGIHLEVRSGDDITEALQAAVDRIVSRGGRLEIPPGTYRISKAIDLAGSFPRFNRPSTTPIVVEGNGSVLEWVGPDEGAMIDLPGLGFSSLKNLHLRGSEGRSWEKLIGFRYRGGLERKNHGGKNNLFESLAVENVGVGIEVGGLFGPDLVGGTFLNIEIRKVRIGFRFMGQNVTSMQLWNPVLEDYRQAGIEILAFGGRVIRGTENDFSPEQKNPRIPVVLMDPDGEREIFHKDLPDWMSASDVKYPTSWVTASDGTRLLMAGGGSLEVTVFNMLARTSHAGAWAVDTNWGWVRVYSGRVLGKGGVFRARERNGLGNYSNMLADITAPDQPEGRVAIQFPGAGILYVVGGYFAGSILTGGEAEVFAMGTRFAPQASFKSLPGTRGTTIHGFVRAWRKSVDIPFGATQVDVPFQKTWMPGSDSYGVEVFPGFPAAGIWVDKKTKEGFRLRWSKPANAKSVIDVVVSTPEYSS